VDQKDQLEILLGSLRTVAKSRPVVLPLHPRTAKSVEVHGLASLLSPLVVTEPLGYLDMLALLEQAEGVLTDSGGVQEETTALGVPCVTLREHTERPITIHEGTNRLAPWPLDIEGVAGAYEEAVSAPGNGRRRPEGWDGQASQRIADALLSLG
jgi:UDP-N-acetylglucosamine 2-epimerase (non-hydrolysing)